MKTALKTNPFAKYILYCAAYWISFVVAYFWEKGKKQTNKNKYADWLLRNLLYFTPPADLCSECLSNAHGVFTIQNLNVRKLYDVRV